MLKRISIIIMILLLLFPSKPIHAEEFKYIEIFDPKQNKVVKIVQMTPEIQKMVSAWIINVEQMYSKIDPITDDGYAVRIPLDPPTKVERNCLKALVNEVYIIIPEKEPVFYLIFENENKLLPFLFNGDIDLLSKALDFQLSSPGTN
jgi:hypothetical protein